MTRFFVLLVAILIGSGCSGQPLDQRLIGRWAEQKTQRTVELTELQVYAISANGEPVESGVWKVEGEELVMEAFGGPNRGKTVRWKTDFDGDDEFVVTEGEAFIRTFLRVKDHKEIFDKRLVGVWQSDSEYPEVIAFSSRGVAIGWAWRVDLQREGDPFTVGSWAKVSRGASDVFRLEGFMGTRQLSAAFDNGFAFEGTKLIWQKPGKRIRPGTFRKIELADLKGSKETVPKPTPRPSSDSKNS